MTLLKLFLLALLLSSSDAFWLSSGCSLDLNKIESKNIPVFFKTANYLIELPNRFTLSRQENVYLACTGSRNYLQQSGLAVTTATCIEGTSMQISGKVVDFTNLKCNKPVEATIRTLQSNTYECSLFTLLSVGYQIHGDFLEKIQLCYDNITKSTVYAHHKLQGQDLQDKAHVSIGSNFKASEVGLQRQTLDGAYRNVRDVNRGHLAPQADFATANSQKSTYFYVNVFPQWQYINNGNWRNVEESIRRHSANKILNVFTGTFGLRPDRKYLLPPFQLPVPQYAWKAVFDQSLSKGIVFLSLNIPRQENILIDPPLCDNCNAYNWGNENWLNGIRGYIFCCQINQTLPPDILRVLPKRHCRVLRGK